MIDEAIAELDSLVAVWAAFQSVSRFPDPDDQVDPHSSLVWGPA